MTHHIVWLKPFPSMSDTWGLTASMYWKCWSEDENQVSSQKIDSRQIIKSILKILENENSEDT